MDSYSVQAVLSAIDKNFTRTMQGAKNTMSDLNGAAQSSKTSIMRIAAGVGVFKLVSKAVGAVTSQVGSAIHRFDTLNNYPKVMQNLGYSAEDASASIQKIQKGLKGLPSSTDQIAAAVQKIAPLTKNLDEATDITLALNNALLAGGKSMAIQNSAMEQYSQMLAAGKVDRQGWLSMLNAMPGQLEQVAKKILGASAGTEDLYNAMKKGTVSFEDFNNAVLALNKQGLPGLESFEQQAKDAIDGIETAISNLQTAITRGLAGSLSSLDTALENNGLPKLSTAINNLSGYIDICFGKINNFIGGLDNLQGMAKDAGIVIGGLFTAGGIAGLPKVAKLAKGKLDKLSVGMKNFGTTIKGYGPKAADMLSSISASFSKVGTNIENIKSPKWLTNIKSLMTEFAPELSTVKESLGKVGTAFGKVGKGAGTFVSKWGGALTGLGKIALKAIAPAALVGGILAGMGLLQQNFGDEIQGLIDTAINKGPEIITGLVNGITSRLPVLIQSGAQLLYQLAEAIKVNLPVIIRGAVEIIEGLVKGISENANTILDAGITIVGALLRSLLQAAPKLLKAGLELIKSLLSGLTNNSQIATEAKAILSTLVSTIISLATMLLEDGPEIIAQLIQGIVDALPTIITAGIEILLGLVNAITENLPTLLEATVQIIQALVQGIVDNLPTLLEGALEIVVAIGQAIIDNLPIILEAAVQIVQAVLEGIATLLTPILEKGKEIVLNIASGIASAASNAWSAITEVVTGIIGKIRDKLSEILAKGKEIVDKIASGIRNKISAGKEAIVSVWNAIKNKITSLISDALQWGKDIVTGIADGIRNAIGTVTSAVSNVASTISGYLHFSRPDKGPLHWYEKWMPDMMRGIANGITSNLYLVQNAANQVADIIAGAQAPFSGQMAYAVGGDVTYGLDVAALAARPIVVDNSILLDGREVAKGTTSYIQSEMNSREKLQSYIQGVK